MRTLSPVHAFRELEGPVVLVERWATVLERLVVERWEIERWAIEHWEIERWTTFLERLVIERWEIERWTIGNWTTVLGRLFFGSSVSSGPIILRFLPSFFWPSEQRSSETLGDNIDRQQWVHNTL
jgi:hypothetical protein